MGVGIPGVGAWGCVVRLEGVWEDEREGRSAEASQYPRRTGRQKSGGSRMGPRSVESTRNIYAPSLRADPETASGERLDGRAQAGPKPVAPGDRLGHRSLLQI